MNSLSQHDITELAQDALGDLTTNGVDLETSLKKLATERELNPHQIKRLAEATNNLVTLHFLKQGSEGNMGFFKLADPNVVISEVYQAESTKEASYDYELIFDILPSEVGSMEKFASEEYAFASVSDETPSYYSPKHTKAINDFKREKVAERLLEEAQVLALTYQEEVTKLASSLTETNFYKLAVDSTMVHGERVLPILLDLHKLANLDAIAFEPTGGNIRYIANTGSDVQKIAELTDLVETINKLCVGRNKIASTLKNG